MTFNSKEKRINMIKMEKLRYFYCWPVKFNISLTFQSVQIIVFNVSHIYFCLDWMQTCFTWYFFHRVARRHFTLPRFFFVFLWRTILSCQNFYSHRACTLFLLLRCEILGWNRDDFSWAFLRLGLGAAHFRKIIICNLIYESAIKSNGRWFFIWKMGVHDGYVDQILKQFEFGQQSQTQGHVKLANKAIHLYVK